MFGPEVVAKFSGSSGGIETKTTFYDDKTFVVHMTQTKRESGVGVIVSFNLDSYQGNYTGDISSSYGSGSLTLKKEAFPESEALAAYIENAILMGATEIKITNKEFPLQVTTSKSGTWNRRGDSLTTKFED